MVGRRGARGATRPTRLVAGDTMMQGQEKLARTWFLGRHSKTMLMLDRQVFFQLRRRQFGAIMGTIVN
jgi:hypothetical protein